MKSTLSVKSWQYQTITKFSFWNFVTDFINNFVSIQKSDVCFFFKQNFVQRTKNRHENSPEPDRMTHVVQHFFSSLNKLVRRLVWRRKFIVKLLRFRDVCSHLIFLLRSTTSPLLRYTQTCECNIHGTRV